MIHRWLIAVGSVLLSAWALLAWWQYQEYGNERHLAEDVLAHQGEAITKALVGGVRSHRRLGRFLEEQIQAMLDEFATSENVLAVSLRSDDGSVQLTAGNRQLLDETHSAQPGWLPQAFLCQQHFELPDDTTGPPAGWGEGPGLGRGWGRGRGGGGGAGLTRADPGDTRASGERGTMGGPLVPGTALTFRLLLDRSHADDQLRNSAWLRGLLVVAAGLFLLAVAMAWHASVNLVDARARTHLLELEARRLRELGQAAAGLAHETRNPLGLIRGWMQRLAEESLAGTRLSQAQAVIEECDRLTARINQFMAFARPRSPQIESIEVRPLIEELANLLEPDLETKSLTIDRARVSQATRVYADREALRQALFNLLGNAIYFSPQGGCLEIALVAGHDACWRIEVADRGPGVPAESMPLLFTPYFTTRPNGTGLGLAIVQQIAAVHGWQAGYTPRCGGGAVFWLDQIHAG